MQTIAWKAGSMGGEKEVVERRRQHGGGGCCRGRVVKNGDFPGEGKGGTLLTKDG